MRRVRVAGQDTGSRLSAPLQVEALAYFARMTVAPSTASRDAVNEAIWRWKTIGAWAQIKGLWLLAADTAQASLLSVIGDTPRDAVTVGTAPPFTALRGYSGFGAASQVRFPISSAILGSDDCFGFTAGIISMKTEATESGPVARPGDLFTAAGVASQQSSIGHMRTAVGSPPEQPVGIYGFSSVLPLIATTAATRYVGGERNGAAINPGGISTRETFSAGQRGTSYSTAATGFHGLDRLSAYGFLASTATNSQCRQFLVILAALLDQLGALD